MPAYQGPRPCAFRLREGFCLFWSLLEGRLRISTTRDCNQRKRRGKTLSCARSKASHLKYGSGRAWQPFLLIRPCCGNSIGLTPRAERRRHWRWFRWSIGCMLPCQGRFSSHCTRQDARSEATIHPFYKLICFLFLTRFQGFCIHSSLLARRSSKTLLNMQPELSRWPTAFSVHCTYYQQMIHIFDF